MQGLEEFKNLILSSDAAKMHVDESQYGLDEWCEALAEFAQWEAQNRPLAFLDKMEYLSCCAQGSVQSGKLIPLSALLEDYLRVHGVAEKR